MDESNSAAVEGLFMVLSSITTELVRRGALDTEFLQIMQTAFEIQRDTTLGDEKRERCAAAAEYAEVLAAIATVEPDDLDIPVTHDRPHLRIVPTDDGERDG